MTTPLPPGFPPWAIIAASLDTAVAEADRDGWIEDDVFLAEIEAVIEKLEREARMGH